MKTRAQQVDASHVMRCRIEMVRDRNEREFLHAQFLMFVRSLNNSIRAQREKKRGLR